MLKKALISLRMTGALHALDNLPESKNKEDFAIALLQAECEYRKQKALERGLRMAAFPIDKAWDEIDPALNPDIDFKSVQILGNGEFVHRKENLCLMGTQGTGKSHSLIALGRQLCEEGFSVKFYTACALVNALEEAKAENQLNKLMKTILKPQLLIIDDCDSE